MILKLSKRDYSVSYGLGLCNRYSFLCVLLSEVQQREKQWSWKNHHEKSICFSQLLPVVLCFQSCLI